MRELCRSYFVKNKKQLPLCADKLLAAGLYSDKAVCEAALEALAEGNIGSFTDAMLCCVYLIMLDLGIEADDGIGNELDAAMVTACLNRLGGDFGEPKVTIADVYALSNNGNYCFFADVEALASLIDNNGVFVPVNPADGSRYSTMLGGISAVEMDYRRQMANGCSIDQAVVFALKTYFDDDYIYFSSQKKLVIRGGDLYCTGNWRLLQSVLQLKATARFMVYLSVEAEQIEAKTMQPVPDGRIVDGFYNAIVKKAYIEHCHSQGIVWSQQVCANIFQSICMCEAEKNRDIAEFSLADMKSYFRDLPVQPQTKMQYMRVLASYIDWCKSNGIFSNLCPIHELKLSAELKDTAAMMRAYVYLSTFDDLIDILTSVYGDAIYSESHYMVIAALCCFAWYGYDSLEDALALGIDYIDLAKGQIRMPYGWIAPDERAMKIFSLVKTCTSYSFNNRITTFDKSEYIFASKELAYYQQLMNRLSKKTRSDVDSKGLTYKKVFKSGLFSRLYEIDERTEINGKISIRAFHQYCQRAGYYTDLQYEQVSFSSLKSLRTEYLAWRNMFYPEA